MQANALWGSQVKAEELGDSQEGVTLSDTTRASKAKRQQIGPVGSELRPQQHKAGQEQHLGGLFGSGHVGSKCARNWRPFRNEQGERQQELNTVGSVVLVWTPGNQSPYAGVAGGRILPYVYNMAERKLNDGDFA